jgi:hypothetical protein
MAGANKHKIEDGPAFFDNNQTTADGFLPLSPVGRSLQTTHAFFVANPDRGVPYAPIALMVDSMHGMGLGWWNIHFKNGSRSEFDPIPGQPTGPFGMAPTLPYTEQDNYMTFFFNTLWPEALPMGLFPNAHDESKRLVNSRYPELWDVLIDDSTTTLGYGMADYPVGLFGAWIPRDLSVGECQFQQNALHRHSLPGRDSYGQSSAGLCQIRACDCADGTCSVRAW